MLRLNVKSVGGCCCIVADYSEEKECYHCKLCGDSILVQGGGNHDR